MHKKFLIVLKISYKNENESAFFIKKIKYSLIAIDEEWRGGQHMVLVQDKDKEVDSFSSIGPWNLEI